MTSLGLFSETGPSSSRATEKVLSQTEEVLNVTGKVTVISGGKIINKLFYTWQISQHLLLRSDLTFAATLATIIVPPLTQCDFNILIYKPNTPAGQYYRA